MVVSQQAITNGIVKFVDFDIAQKSQGLQKFAAYMFIPTIPDMVHHIIDQYKGTFHHYFDENENIDLDKLYSDTKQAMDKAKQVEFSGIIFTEEDIDTLYRYIRQCA